MPMQIFRNVFQIPLLGERDSDRSYCSKEQKSNSNKQPPKEIVNFSEVTYDY